MFYPCAIITLSLALSSAQAISPTALPAPGQPQKTGTPLTFEIVGNSGVSAQQMFLGTENTIYIVDKTEANPLKVKNHPAWASEITLDTGDVRPMDVYSNSFCAGGNFLGDGRLLNVGGNEGITTGGFIPSGSSQPADYGGSPYYDYDGGAAIRLLTPCANQTCNWIDNPKNYMTSRRWYPTIETLADGAAFIMGGDSIGGFVNDATQNNPTYEFWPSKGNPVASQILSETLPANLYPLAWLLPSGSLFIQTNWETELLDLTTGKETFLANVPHAVRTYPASGASVMLPLIPDNNYTATILLCGGANRQNNEWNPNRFEIISLAADNTCVRITPDGDKKWRDDAKLPEGRTMGNFILLPDGTIFLVNGGGVGTAGYGTQSWTAGDSYADQPRLSPLIYYPSNQTFSRAGLGKSIVPRLYHSSAIVLPDGSVFIAGSNPHPDYVVETTYPTEYRTERFYPWYYSMRRPEPNGLLSQLGYGGSYFNVTLSKDDMNGDPNTNAPLTKAVILRTGFSTHSINMGQRYLELQTSYTINLDGTVIVHISQLPPNSNIFAPGPAVIHIVVAGVPSVGKIIMVGSGVIETQVVNAVVNLPSSGVQSPPSTTTPVGGSSGKKGAAAPQTRVLGGALAGLSAAIFAAAMSLFLS